MRRLLSIGIFVHRFAVMLVAVVAELVQREGLDPSTPAL